MMKVFLEIKPTYKHRLIDCESGEDLTEEEAIEIVKEYWDDMGSSYYTWTLEKVIFHESIDVPKELSEIIDEIAEENDEMR